MVIPCRVKALRASRALERMAFILDGSRQHAALSKELLKWEQIVGMLRGRQERLFSGTIQEFADL